MATKRSIKNIHIDKKKENKKVGPKIRISEKNPKLGGALIFNLIKRKHQKDKKGTVKINLLPKKILREP